MKTPTCYLNHWWCTGKFNTCKNFRNDSV